MPGVAKHADGTQEAWWKYERMRVFQDNYGRAIQANFAVVDVEKDLDRPRDINSSKNICIPLMPGRLLTILDKTPTANTVRIKVQAENDFNPRDIDISSLHFGPADEVNYGLAGKVVKTENLAVT